MNDASTDEQTVTSVSDEEFNRRHRLLKVARRQVRIADRLNSELTSSESDVILHILRGWVALGTSFGAEETVSEALSAIPDELLECGDFGTRKELEAALLQLEPLADVLSEVPGSEDLSFDRLSVHCDILLRTLEKVMGDLYRSSGRVDPLKRALAVGGAVLAALILCIAAFYFFRPRGPWIARYFAGQEPKGTPIFVGHVPKIDFEWGSGSPDPSVASDNFSAVFYTCLHVSQGSSLFFEIGSDDGSRLFLNGEQIIDHWGPHAYTQKTHERRLDAGRYLLRLEYFEAGGGAKLTTRVLHDGVSVDRSEVAKFVFPKNSEGSPSCD